MRHACVWGAAGVLVLAGNVFGQATLNNGGFENPVIGGPVVPFATFGPDIAAYHAADVPGWQTTDVNNAIEIWRSGAVDPGPSGLTFIAYEGDQFAEINAYSDGTLSTTVTPAAGSIIGFDFAHRGRDSSIVPDVISVNIFDLGVDGVSGGGNDTLLLGLLFAATNTAWQFHTQPLGFATGNTLSLEFGAVSTGGGDPLMGNFLDAIAFGQDVPEPATGMLTLIGAAAVCVRRRR